VLHLPLQLELEFALLLFQMRWSLISLLGVVLSPRLRDDPDWLVGGRPQLLLFIPSTLSFLPRRPAHRIILRERGCLLMA
jgi:hypothetical protein